MTLALDVWSSRLAKKSSTDSTTLSLTMGMETCRVVREGSKVKMTEVAP